MSKRVERQTTKEYVINAPLPQQTQTYTVIAHRTVIAKTMASLAHYKFEVEQELYRATQNAEVAQGVYNLKHQGDLDMGLMFAWSNSYDKSMRFRCAIGGRVFISGSRIIPGNMGSWGRVHTGTADQDTNKQIEEQISNAANYFNQLITDKENMKNITVPLRKAAELLGVLFIERKLITGEQLNIVKQELKKPTFDYKVAKDSLWSFYNHIIFALQKSHPRTWMDQQRLSHWFICDEFGLNNINGINQSPAITPIAEEQPANQISIYDTPEVDPDYQRQQ